MVLAVVCRAGDDLARGPLRSSLLRGVRNRVRHRRHPPEPPSRLSTLVLELRDLQPDADEILRRPSVLPSGPREDARLRPPRQLDLRRPGVRRCLLRGTTRWSAQRTDPRAPDLALLDQLPHAHLRMAKPARAGGVH